MEPDPERADNVEHVALFEGCEAGGATADAFVEKLDAAASPVDTVDALRPPQPQLSRIRRRAQEIEKLARLDGERLWGRCDDEMPVFVIHPIVRNHRTQRFLG